MKYYPHTRLCMEWESWDPADIAKAKKLSPQEVSYYCLGTHKVNCA